MLTVTDEGSIPDRRDLVKNKPKVSYSDVSLDLATDIRSGGTSRQEQPDHCPMAFLRSFKGI